MNETESPSTTRPDPGSPPQETERALEKLYKPLGSVTAPKQESTVFRAESHAEPVIPAPLPQLSESDRRLLSRLRDSLSQLTIRVNQVELTLDVVAVDKNESSICCLVRENGLRCKIPRSENVEIELEGQLYTTAFLGSWHTIPWLSVHVVVFPILPDPVKT